MKKKICFAFIAVTSMIAISLLWFLCLKPNIGSILINEPDKYMEINDSTQQLLDEYAKGILPLDTTVLSEHLVYEYRYQCSIFGDPVCSIYLSGKLSDQNVFISEEQRIQDLAVQRYNLRGGEVLYTTNTNIQQNWDLYTDGVTEDGKIYIFELAIIDSENQNIKYLFAVQQDGQIKSNTVLEMLEQVIF